MIIDMGYNHMSQHQLNQVLYEVACRQLRSQSDSVTDSQSPQLQTSSDSVVQEYFDPTLYDASLMFPSEVFRLIHPDDTHTHSSYYPHERAFKSAFHDHGIPQPHTAPRLVMIDAGMATALSQRDKTNFNDLFYCIATGSGEEAAKLLIERARPIPVRDGESVSVVESESHVVNGHTVTIHSLPHNPYQSRLDRERFISEVSLLINQAASHGFNLSTMGVVSTLTSLLSAARNYHVKLDTSFISVVIAVTVMEGVGRSLDDQVDVVGPALKIVAATKLKDVQKDLMKKID